MKVCLWGNCQLVSLFLLVTCIERNFEYSALVSLGELPIVTELKKLKNGETRGSITRLVRYALSLTLECWYSDGVGWNVVGTPLLGRSVLI
ncbi:hypothetical protein V6N11_036274 [Hibiscus sabdariffa]|uniref:Secreted protein n=1 Tax=Hibiscus sabdariffa TaxID=183260 RepID=A0ABR2R9V6_9ROSI